MPHKFQHSGRVNKPSGSIALVPAPLPLKPQQSDWLILSPLSNKRRSTNGAHRQEDVSIDEQQFARSTKCAVHLQLSVGTDAAPISKALKPFQFRVRRVGREICALSSWLHQELKALAPGCVS